MEARRPSRRALAYYWYSDVNEESSTSILRGNAGNTTVDGDGQPHAFRSQFGILHVVSALTLDRFRLPLSFSGEYIWNSRAGIDEDQGWAAGATFGKTQRRNDVRLYYQWQVIEQDAVFSPFAQDDFLFQTNHRSHLFGGNYQLADWLGLHSWFLVSRRDKASARQSEEYFWRFRFDANVKFLSARRSTARNRVPLRLTYSSRAGIGLPHRHGRAMPARRGRWASSGRRSSAVRRRGQSLLEYVLEKLAEETGGSAFLAERIEDLAGVYGRIAAELKSQYNIAYTSSNAVSDGAWRRIDVLCDRSGVVVKTRSGYHAPRSGASGRSRRRP